MSTSETLQPAAPWAADDAKRRVAAYYDRMQVFYSHLWSSTGVRYGFWDAATRRRADAIRAMDQEAARRLALPPGARVLDAGCGVGGTALYLALRERLAVTGVTLSRAQLRRARRFAAQVAPAALRPRFLLADYTATGLPAASFDGVVGIESVCYAEPPAAFAREAARLLRAGGRLVVMDGFLGTGPRSARDARAYRRFLDGFALSRLAAADELGAALARAGFRDVRVTDVCERIRPAAWRIQILAALGLALGGLPSALGLAPRCWARHALAGLAQRRLFRDGVLTYAIVEATRA